MYAVANLNKVNENTNYVAIIELNVNALKMLKNKAPYEIIAVGETEDEVLETAGTEWFLLSSLAEGWYKVVALDEIEIF